MAKKHKALSDNYPEPRHADGQELKRMRENLRVTQEDLSVRSGVSQDLISRIESGSRTFTKNARNKIWPVMAKLLDQHAEELKSRVAGFGPALEKARAAKAQETGGFPSLQIPKTPEEYAAGLKSYSASSAAFDSLTIEERLQFEKALLEAQLQAAREVIAGKDAQIATLIKALEAAMREHPKRPDEAEATKRGVARLHREESGN